MSIIRPMASTHHLEQRLKVLLPKMNSPLHRSTRGLSRNFIKICYLHSSIAVGTPIKLTAAQRNTIHTQAQPQIHTRAILRWHRPRLITRSICAIPGQLHLPRALKHAVVSVALFPRSRRNVWRLIATRKPQVKLIQAHPMGICTIFAKYVDDMHLGS